MSDLTEAAARLLTEKHYDYWESNRNLGACDDAHKVATWSAKMLDETPIDEAWLRSVECEWNIEHDHVVEFNGTTVFVQERVVEGIKTRGQLRMLCRSLSIELREQP